MSDSKMLLVNNKYKLTRKLGNGSFGSIFHGINIETNEEVAIKMEAIDSRH